MVDYPLETQRGNGGCGLKVADWYHPHRNILSREQQHVLSELVGIGDAHQANVINQMLAEYGSSQYRLKKRTSGMSKVKLRPDVGQRHEKSCGQHSERGRQHRGKHT